MTDIMGLKHLLMIAKKRVEIARKKCPHWTGQYACCLELKDARSQAESLREALRAKGIE